MRDGVGNGAGVEMDIARGNGGKGFPVYSLTERETLGRTEWVVGEGSDEVEVSPMAFRKVRNCRGVFEVAEVIEGDEFVEEGVRAEGGSLEVRVVMRRGVENYQVEIGDLARRMKGFLC